MYDVPPLGKDEIDYPKWYSDKEPTPLQADIGEWIISKLKLEFPSKNARAAFLDGAGRAVQLRNYYQRSPERHAFLEARRAESAQSPNGHVETAPAPKATRTRKTAVEPVEEAPAPRARRARAAKPEPEPEVEAAPKRTRTRKAAVEAAPEPEPARPARRTRAAAKPAPEPEEAPKPARRTRKPAAAAAEFSAPAATSPGEGGSRRRPAHRPRRTEAAF
jgi:outer membrane biosynthesis protein TonB